MPIDEDEDGDIRLVHSDEGPDRTNLEDLEQKVGGFEEFKDLVDRFKEPSKSKKAANTKKPAPNKKPSTNIPPIAPKANEKVQPKPDIRAVVNKRIGLKEDKSQRGPGAKNITQKRPAQRSTSQPNNNEKNDPQLATMKKAINHHLQLNPLEQMVRELARKHNPDIKFQRDAFFHLRSVSESFLISVFTKASQISKASGRVTLMKRDFDAFCSIVNLDEVMLNFRNSNFK